MNNSTDLHPTHQRFAIVAILFVTLLIAFIDRVNVSVLAADPKFLTDMGIKGNTVKIGLLMTLFLIAYGLSNVILGPIGDKIGPKKAMALSLSLWGVSCLLGGIAPAFGLLLATRVILGLGEGLHWPMQSKFVKNWFPPQERARANSIWVLGLFIGPAVGMPFFTWLVGVTQWRSTFYLLAGLSLIPVFLITLLTTDHPSQNKRVNKAELDYIEDGLKEEAAKEGSSEKVSFGESVKSFITDYHFWLITVYYMCQCSIWWGTMTWLPSYLKVVRHFSWSSMGVFSSLPYILGCICLILFGRISDKSGKRAPYILFGITLCTVCLLAAALVSSNIASALLLSVSVGALGITSTCVWSLLQQIVPGRVVGTGSGLMNGIANGFSSLAPFLFGVFISAVGSYNGGLFLLVGMGVVGMLCVGVLVAQKY